VLHFQFAVTVVRTSLLVLDQPPMDSFTTTTLPVCFEDGPGPLLTGSASEEALLHADFDTVNPHGSRAFCVVA
jgi:hypothetical protein